MDITWYLVLSALLFAVGVSGVLLRRSPLVILLCLELMLNAGNLALLAFSRSLGNQDGQVFALIVMVIAACEVVVGLGIIVAAYVGNVDEPLWEPIPGQRFIAPVLGIALFVELAIAITGSGLQAIDTHGPTVELGFGSPSAIGKLLLERFLIAFEAASLLLLVAAVGAVVLAGRHPSPTPGTPAGEAEEVAG